MIAMLVRHPNLEMISIQHRRAAVEHDMRRRDGMHGRRPRIDENARGWRGEQKYMLERIRHSNVIGTSDEKG
jgi:hypothetical protein